uniref:site-specific DNA-methyltransferase (adenine-specific) n=1 Tax=viral metagenome TaxID=1070528 RepID=A0A6C0LFR2_9ZZZZ
MKHAKKSLGQYFTTDESLQNAIKCFILNDPIQILEPSVGRGDLVASILQEKPTQQFVMIEIDETIDVLPSINRDAIRYENFLLANIKETFKTIVGNPPFVRTKTGNLYIDFIAKSFLLLEPGGELIFIVPSDFFKVTGASKVISNMMLHGTFTHIYHPHNEHLFQGASIDVLVFRYCKDAALPNEIFYNDVKMQLRHTNGLVTFYKEKEKEKEKDQDKEKENQKKANLSDIFQICVGLVSGKEDIYKNAILGNLDVLNGENKVEKYIFTEIFPTETQEINNYLLEHKPALLDRAIRKFTEKNWFEWGAPRNIQKMRDHIGKPCIYIYTLTRQPTVAFLSTVQYFGAGLLMLLPKNNISANELKETVDRLNSTAFRQNFTFSGRFKIGQRQLCNCQI